MATRAYQSDPLDVLLTAIPSLPRPILARLTARLVERLDEMDGDPDLEDDDPDTGVEDDPRGIDPEEDMGAEDVGEDCQGGDVCLDARPIADPAAYREHVRRLKRDRCYPLRRASPSGWGTHQLWQEPEVPTRRQLLRRKRGVPRHPRA